VKSRLFNRVGTNLLSGKHPKIGSQTKDGTIPLPSTKEGSQRAKVKKTEKEVSSKKIEPPIRGGKNRDNLKKYQAGDGQFLSLKKEGAGDISLETDGYTQQNATNCIIFEKNKKGEQDQRRVRTKSLKSWIERGDDLTVEKLVPITGFVRGVRKIFQLWVVG